MTTTSVARTGLSRSPCGCQEQTPSQACCCNLVCFDRPNYFCGHLLTDSDLTLQQKYVVEKNKLYHRTMDGYGIVCGLKLTCDCDCKGNILIHDGFAIDDCGNDLVVCQTTRFDVIGALRSKGLLVFDAHEDDCEPKRRKSRCDIKQCFYITICYDETQSDYETPFQSSCTSGPKQCMPTRTHEGVRFEVTDTLPPRHSYIDDLEKRIRECFEVNCDSPVGDIIKQHADDLLYIFGDTDSQGNQGIEPCELFCMLRAYFLNHLKINPDQFNCNLFDEVSCLSCPSDWYDDYEQHSERVDQGRHKSRRERRREHFEKELQEEEASRYREEMREAFRKLLYYMQRYQYDCVFGDLVFTCQQPCEANCLVLGTVEVLNGKLVRVCNTPRKYLWAPANLVQVLIYDIMTGGLTAGEGCEGMKVPCCPDYRNFDPLYFLTEFRVSRCGRRDAATSSTRAFREVSQSLHEAFDFTDSTRISSAVFARTSPDEKEAAEYLRAAETLFGISTSTDKLKAGLNPLTPIQALLANALLRRNDSVVAYESDGETKKVLTDLLAEISPDPSVGDKLRKLLSQTHDNPEVTELRAEIETLKRRMADMEEVKKPKKSKDD